LQNAGNSYRDVLFWWAKTYLMEKGAVSLNNLAAPDPLKLSGVSASTVNDAIFANWRSALRYAREAERAVNTLKS
jgi:hypothetical protein